VQFLTEQQKDYSYQWAREMLAMMEAAGAAGRPLIMVFSDESRFCLDSDRRWVRYLRGQWKKTALRLMSKFPKGVRVWGAIGPGYKSPLPLLCGSGVVRGSRGNQMLWRNATSCTVIGSGSSNRTELRHTERCDLGSALSAP
jgi:hypothetical protein